MKIDWDIKNQPKPRGFVRWCKRLLTRNTSVPLHMSDHYVRDHFHP